MSLLSLAEEDVIFGLELAMNPEKLKLTEILKRDCPEFYSFIAKQIEAVGEARGKVNSKKYWTEQEKILPCLRFTLGALYKAYGERLANPLTESFEIAFEEHQILARQLKINPMEEMHKELSILSPLYADTLKEITVNSHMGILAQYSIFTIAKIMYNATKEER